MPILLQQLQHAEAMGCVEVGLRQIHGAPAHKVGLWRLIPAFIEIAVQLPAGNQLQVPEAPQGCGGNFQPDFPALPAH